MATLNRLSVYGVVAWDEACLRSANDGLALAALLPLCC